MPVTVSEETLAELKEKYGTKAKIGRITMTEGKCVFTVGGRRYTLDESQVLASQPLSKMVGKGSVAGGVIIEGKPAVIVIISGRPGRLRPPILCYVPVPDLRRRVDEAVRGALVANLVKKGALPQAALREMQARTR